MYAPEPYPHATFRCRTLWNANSLNPVNVNVIEVSEPQVTAIDANTAFRQTSIASVLLQLAPAAFSAF